MPIEIREILLQAQLADDPAELPRGDLGEARLERFRDELLEEVRRMIREEFDRRARR